MSTTAPETPAKRIGQQNALGRPTSQDVTTRMLTAVWCRSVGTAWTLELRELDHDIVLGTIRDWITSGIPISQPEPPETLARELLAERGMHLFSDSSAGPCTHNRRGIGYVCRNAEVIRLANLIRDDAADTGIHPIALATPWVMAGFSADIAAKWIHEGVRAPQAARHTVHG
ncbi:MAG TPA: hypothetical protein VN748_06735 [Pseudonocardiaceae bacterium]|jgi:hypothetical protein|nr:hypothetical protein [Pseudonocardiaceae bacterium]